MLTKEERKAIHQKFWTSFDLYCQVRPEKTGIRKKWILHHTGISHVDLKFDLTREAIQVALEINHRSEEFRLAVFELLLPYRSLLESGFDDGLVWDFCCNTSDGREVARIYCEARGLDYQRIEDWEALFAFMATKMGQLQENFLEIEESLKESILQLNRHDD